MSTSDRDRPGAPAPGPASATSPWDAAFAAIAADPALVGRIANELFAALPGEPPPAALPAPFAVPPSLPSAPQASPSVPAAPAVPQAVAPAPLTEAELRALPAALGGATGTSTLPPNPAPGQPSFPGSAYYFLEKPRVSPPLVPPALPFQGLDFRPDALPSPPSPPSPAPPVDPATLAFSPAAVPAAAYAPPTEVELRALPTTVAGATGAPPLAHVVSPTPPAFPGSPLPTFGPLEGEKAAPPRAEPSPPFQAYELPPEMLPGALLSGAAPPSASLPAIQGQPQAPSAAPPTPHVPAALPVPGEADLRALPATPGSATVPLPPIPPAAPATGTSPGFQGEKAAPPRALEPGRFQGGEFRPEVMPDATPTPVSPAEPSSVSPPPSPPRELPAGVLSDTDLFSLGALPSLALGLPLSFPGPSPSAVPGPSFYFLDEGQTALARAEPPPRLASLEPTLQPVPDLGLARRPFDPRAVRRDFPILSEKVHGRPLIWLDNAATTQKPNAVIDRLSQFYRHEYSNIHRAAHALAARATDAYEGAREKVRNFLHASSTREIVFVRGTTEGVNLVAQSWGRRHVGEGDEIVITWLEHHANIVPWQLLCAEKGARLRVAPVDDSGQVILEEYEKLLGPRTRLVALSHVSNALGTITPTREMVAMAHRHGARVLVDGAQAVSHLRVDVQDLDCDWYVLSGHKVFAPSGIGVVFGKSDVLEESPPWQGGGNMIACVTFEKTTYQPPPARFEAGTPSIADAVGLGAAIDYFESVGVEAASAYEHGLLRYATAGLETVPGLHLIGTAREKASVLSFVLDGFRPEEVGAALDKEGIAVRAGHHCAQPILRRFGVEATVRPSLAFYNTCEDVDALVTALLRIQAGRGHRGV